MKDIKTFLLSLIFVIAVTSIAFAAEEKKAEPVPSELPVASKIQQITAEVRAVNTNTLSIIVTKKIRDKVIETVLTVNNETKILKENEKKTFADIKIGDKVVVRYTKVDGKNVAKNISIKPAKPESKEKETEKQGKPLKK